MPPTARTARGIARAGKRAAVKAAARDDRDLTRTYTRAQFVAKLRRFADAIETNAPFTIQVANQRLRVPAGVTFNIEHERTGTREELEFQVIWSSGEAPPSKARKRG